MRDTYNINLYVDIEHCRMALVGDGYLLEEVERMSSSEVLRAWKLKFETQIEQQYYNNKRLNLIK